MKRTLIAAAFALGFAATAAEARDIEDCQLFWGQAVRGYLTKNVTKGPEDASFRPACELEAKGDKPAARIEAVSIGVKALAALDMKACNRFMEYYVGATLPAAICEKAGGDMDALRKLVADGIPAAPGAQ